LPEPSASAVRPGAAGAKAGSYSVIRVYSCDSWLILSVSQASVPPTQSEFDIDRKSLYLFPMTAVTVSSKYQIVIPREARQKLGISSGTRLQAIPEAGGLRLVKEPSIDEICGLLRGMPVDDAGIRSERDRTLP